MTNKQVSREQFDQTAAELKKGVASAVKAGLEKLRAKRLADNQTALRLIAQIPAQIASAIVSCEPQRGSYFDLTILQGDWNEAYCKGQMAYDECTSVVMAYCLAAGLHPKRLETVAGYEILISFTVEETQLPV